MKVPISAKVLQAMWQIVVSAAQDESSINLLCWVEYPNQLNVTFLICKGFYMLSNLPVCIMLYDLVCFYEQASSRMS